MCAENFQYSDQEHIITLLLCAYPFSDFNMHEPHLTIPIAYSDKKHHNNEIIVESAF